MNEYQDQVLWWEVQAWIGHRWVYVSDHEDSQDARDWQRQYEENNPDTPYRVKRVAGLDA